jgi:hypothetical protein
VSGYVVVVERAEDSTFGAWSPDLVAAGRLSEEQAIARLLRRHRR